MDDRPIGRAAFLGPCRRRGGRPRSSAATRCGAPGGSSRTSCEARADARAGGSTRSGQHPADRPGRLPAEGRGHGGTPASRSRSRICGRCRGPSRSRTSTASPAGRSTTSAGPASASRMCSPTAGPRPDAKCAPLRLGRGPVRRHADAPAGAPSRRDARARHGRQAALRAARGPARVVMPQMYGYKSVKWVTRIEVRPHRVRGYWEQRGYDADAWIGGSNGLRAPSARSVHPAVRPHRADAPLDARGGFFALLATGLILYLPVLAGRRAPAARQERAPRLARSPGRVAIVLVLVLGDRRRLPPTGARSRRSTATTAAGSAAEGAAGPLQRRPEAERDRSPPPSPSSSRLGVLALARRARPPLPASTGRSPSTTR